MINWNSFKNHKRLCRNNHNSKIMIVNSNNDKVEHPPNLLNINNRLKFNFHNFKLNNKYIRLSKFKLNQRTFNPSNRIIHLNIENLPRFLHHNILKVLIIQALLLDKVSLSRFLKLNYYQERVYLAMEKEVDLD